MRDQTCLIILKSFAQAFSKACGFQRQSLWSLSAESENFMFRKAQEGRKTFQWNVFRREPSQGVPDGEKGK